MTEPKSSCSGRQSKSSTTPTINKLKKSYHPHRDITPEQETQKVTHQSNSDTEEEEYQEDTNQTVSSADEDTDEEEEELANSNKENRNKMAPQTRGQSRNNKTKKAAGKDGARMNGNDDMKAALEKLIAENLALKAKNAKLNSKKTSVTVRAITGKMSIKDIKNHEDYNSAMEGQVRKEVGKKLWRVCKFIKNDERLNAATTIVMEAIDPGKYSLEGIEEGTDDHNSRIQDRNNFISLYREIVRDEINGKRSYVQVSYCAFDSQLPCTN